MAARCGTAEGGYPAEGDAAAGEGGYSAEDLAAELLESIDELVRLLRAQLTRLRPDAAGGAAAGGAAAETEALLQGLQQQWGDNQPTGLRGQVMAWLLRSTNPRPNPNPNPNPYPNPNPNPKPNSNPNQVMAWLRRSVLRRPCVAHLDDRCRLHLYQRGCAVVSRARVGLGSQYPHAP